MRHPEKGIKITYEINFNSFHIKNIFISSISGWVFIKYRQLRILGFGYLGLKKLNLSYLDSLYHLNYSAT
jgi:hypothetical protein